MSATTLNRRLLKETEATAKVLPANDGIFEAVLITPGMGSSGHYSAEALKDAADRGLFAAGTHVYFDHPSDSEEWDRPERSVRDIAGVLETAGEWRDNGDNGSGVYAKVRIFETYKDLIVQMHQYVGMSIRAYCEGVWVENEFGGYYDVVRFEEVLSVDVVTHAGRGGALLRMAESAKSKARLRSENGAVSSAPADHKEGTNMDPEDKQALAEMKAMLTELPGAVASALAEALKPAADAEDQNKTVNPVEVAKGMVKSLSTSGIPATLHTNVLALVESGVPMDTAISTIKAACEASAPASRPASTAMRVGEAFMQQPQGIAGGADIGSIVGRLTEAARKAPAFNVVAKGA